MSKITYNFSGKLYLNNFIKRYEIIFKVVLPDSCVSWEGPFCSIPTIQKYLGKTETFYWSICLPSRHYKIKKPIKKLSKRKVWEYIKRVGIDSNIYRDDDCINSYLRNNKLVLVQDLEELDPIYLFHKLDINYTGRDVSHNSLRKAIIEELKNRKT